MSVPAIVLAAGASTRMGRPKPLLFLEGICATLREAGANPLLVVVAAPHGELVERAAAQCGARAVWNPEPERGQVSSVACGLEAARAPYALVALADQPQITAATVRTLLAAAAREPDVTHVPTYQGNRGHPVVMPCSLAARLRTARSAREATADAREHPVDDPGILLDVDTPEDLRQWEAR